MLGENTSINDEIIAVDNVKKPVTFTSKMVRTAIVLTSVTVGAGLGYLWNEITDQWTKDYPGSGYNPEVENRYGSLKGIVIGTTVGLLLSLSACNWCVLSDYFVADEINNETSPLLTSFTTTNNDVSVPSTSFGSTLTIPSFADVKIKIDTNESYPSLIVAKNEKLTNSI